MVEQGGQQLAGRIRAQGDILLRLLSSLDDAMWRRRPAPDEWMAAEIAGHLIEMLPYWSAKGGQLRNDPTTPYGRELDDPDRLAGPGMGPVLNLDEARGRLAAELEQAAAFLESLTETELAAGTTHADGSPETVREMVERTIATHLEQHVRQLGELLKR